jgi:heme/copper-type cytochrome/quinol oxidase subunit 1
MTVTEAPSSAPTETAATPQARGLNAVLGTGDHRTVGRLWMGLAGVFLVVTTVVNAMLGLERMTVDELEILGSDNVLQFFTLYRVGVTFLVVMPLFIGLATFVVPLQVGARTVAFPRAAAAAFWGWLGGGLLLLLSYALDGGPGGSELEATDLWILALILVVVSLLLATICVATTVVTLRTPDMDLMRVPPFSWSMLVAATVWVASLPVLLAGLLLAYLDHRYGQVAFGSAEELYPRLAWAFQQPQVYAMAIPVLGVAAEVFPVVSGVVQRHRGLIWIGIALYGALSFGADIQPAVDPGILEDAVYIAASFAVVLPVLIVAGGLTDDVLRGRLRLVPPFVLSDIAVGVLLLATLVGAVAVIEPLELLDTTWQEGHLNLVVGASLLGVVAGLVWWAPRISGRTVPALLAHGTGLVVTVGVLLLAVPEAITGLLDQPAAWYTGFDPEDGVEALNTVAAVGAIVLVLGALLVILVMSRTAGRPPDEVLDPWEGQTLEWSGAAEVPRVTSATPLRAEEGEA